MEIFQPEPSSSRLRQLLIAVPAAAALLFAATTVHAQECAVDADCAPGFECAWAGESNSSVGGGPGPVCGDDHCDAGETEENCPQDCSLDRTCQVASQLCNEDEECAPGFYCDDEGGGVSVTGTLTGSTTGGMNYDGTCQLLGTTSSGTDGGSATDGGAGAGGEETTGSDDGNTGEGPSSTGTTGLGSGSGGGGNGGPSGGDGGPVSGNGGPSGGNGNGHGGGHHGGGHGHGPWKPGWPGHPGCSVGAAGTPAGGLLVTALAGLGAVFMRRRRS